MVVAVLSKYMGQLVDLLLLHLLENAIADAGCQLDECQHILDLFEREHANRCQVELSLHLFEEIFYVSADKVCFDDLFCFGDFNIREHMD